MIAYLREINIKFVLLVFLLIILAFFTGNIISRQSPLRLISVVILAALCIITFINTDAGLIFLIFSMLLSPELLVGAVPGRAVVLRMDDIFLFAVFFTWFSKIAIKKEIVLFRRNNLTRPIIIYILVCILFTALGIITGHVTTVTCLFYILKYIEYFMIFFMFVNNIRSKEQIKVFVTFLLITCAIVCIYGYVQFGTVTRVSTPFEGFGEPNTLAGYLLFLFAITAALLLYSDSRKIQFLLAALACFIIPVFLFTYSRGAYLGFVPVCLALLVFSKKRRAVLIVILILLLLITPLILPQSVIERIKITFIPGKKYEVLGTRLSLEESGALRVESWQKLVREKLPKSPLTGYGITGVGFIDSNYFLVLGEVGLVGFGVFIWLLVCIFRNGLSSLRVVKDNFSQGLALGFLAGFIGLLIQALTANTFIIVRIMEPFWFLTALVVMLPVLEKEKELSSEQEVGRSNQATA